jgi:glycosyltransferase involved in cell wall biosynthesis
MRVLFVNTYDMAGGAAIAAMRLHEGLQNYCNTENYFIVGDKKSELSNVFPSRNYLQKKMERIVDIISSKIGLQYQYSVFSGANIIKIAKALKPDIINLHNTHGGYFATKDLASLSAIAPIVWTLHDMWSFTGNAAHTFGDDSWKFLKNSSHLKYIYPAIGINTGGFLLKQKKKIYQNSRITVVTPSKWLQNLASQSPVFDKIEVKHINNGIDLQLFKRQDKLQIRKDLGIHPNAKVLMFVAESISKKNPWKGGSQLINIIAGINDTVGEKIELLIIGKGGLPSDKYQNFNIHNMGYVADAKKMAAYLNAADVFIYPTKADNLPNVLLEAIACGTPCICNDVGGCNEIVIDNLNGYIIKSGLEEFIEKTVGLLFSGHLENFSANCLAHSKSFDLKSVSEQYYALFNEMVPS